MQPQTQYYATEWEVNPTNVLQQKGMPLKRQALVPIHNSVLQRYIIAPFQKATKGALNGRKERGGRRERGETPPKDPLQFWNTQEVEPDRTTILRRHASSDDVFHLRQLFHTRPTSTTPVTLGNFPDEVLRAILGHLGFAEHLKHWHRASSKLNMDPVDEIADMVDILQVVEYSQDILNNSLSREAELWSPNNARKMHTAIVSQREVTVEMRRVLVDWLIEVHFKFRLKPQTLYTAIGLVNRILFAEQVPRRDLQTIGVAAVMVAAKFEERFAPAINDLVYITSHSSTRHKIVTMERDILRLVDYELALPSAWHFINRFAKIVGLTRDETLMANYLIDLTLPEHTCVHVRPSLIVCGAIYLLKQLQHQAPWHDKLSFYSKYSEEEVKEMADDMLQIAKRSKSTSVPKKYKTSTYGGVTPAVQELLASVSEVMAM